MKMYRFEGKTIKEHLLGLAENEYKQFAASLNPGVEGVLGIRIPALRALAKRIAKSDWREFVANVGTEYMEERMLHGLVIGYAKMSLDERFHLIQEWVPRICSWSICDTVCTTFKPKNGDESAWWEFVKPHFEAEGEYEIRFAVVMALDHFIDIYHLKEIFELVDAIRNDAYYVEMGIAWLLSMCYVKFPDVTMLYLKDNHLNDFTFNKTLQKIIESYQATDEQKAIVRKMKRKK